MARRIDRMHPRDIRMVQRGQSLRFALESREPVGVQRERVRQDLECDVAIQRREVFVIGDNRSMPARLHDFGRATMDRVMGLMIN